MKRFLSILLVLICLLTIMPTAAIQSSAKTNYNKVYYSYIKKNLKVLNQSKFKAGKTARGVVSAVIKDLDGDKIPELVTFSVVADKEEKSLNALKIYLYKYTKGKVKLCSKSKSIPLYSAGSYEATVCCVIKGKKIKIFEAAEGYGGSVCWTRGMSFVVKNNKLKRTKCFKSYAFYRYDQFEYVEEVSGKKYSSYDALENAEKKAGLDSSCHCYSCTDYKSGKGGHVFRLVNSNDICPNEVKDNTKLRSKLKSY